MMNSCLNAIRRISFTIILITIGTTLSAQQTGKVKGTVINSKTGAPVIGANVFVKGTQKGSATNMDGEFEIRLKPGEYDIRFSYISLKEKTMENVQIAAGEVKKLGKVKLNNDLKALDGVIISADRIKSSEKAMLSLKKKSSKVIDGISAERISKTGDGTAAAAMKRVTGVSVQGGKYVFVRGLGGRYTKTTLNGVSVPGLDPNRNSLQLDIFPTDILSNMVVSKTFTPELPADFTGGLVDIETKEFPSKKTFKVSASLGYNPGMHFNKDHLTYKGGSTDFLGFDDGTRSIPTGGSENVPFVTDAFGGGQEAQRYTEILRNFNPNMDASRDMSFMDFSLGLSGGNQFTMNDLKIGYNFALTYSNSTKYHDDVEYSVYGKPEDPTKYELELREKQAGGFGKNSVLAGALGGIAVKSARSKYSLDVLHLQNGVKKAGLYNYTGSDQGSNFQAVQHNLEYTERSLTNAILNGTHYSEDGSWEIDWKLSPTLSTIDEPDIRYSRVRTDGQGYSISSESGIPQRIWRYLEEVNHVAKVDFTRKYKFSGKDAKLNFGAAYTYKQRDYEIQAFDIIPQNGVEITSTNPSQIMKDKNLWSLDNPDGTIYSPNFIPTNPNKYNASVNKPAAYISNEIVLFKDLNALFGVRAEKYVQRYTGIDPVDDEQINNRKVLDDLDFFPSINLNYALTEDQNLRASYSQTIARPSFKEASKATIFDPISGRYFIGGLIQQTDGNGNVIWDGNLTATRINNFDLRWEWFQKGEQMVSVSAFYKTFEDPIEMVQIRQAKNNIQPRNVGDGEVMGVELELRQNLSRISRGLRAFSINTNVTFTRSRIDIGPNELQSRRNSAREGEEIDDARKMAGQAPYIVNAGISYNGTGNAFEAGIYYNVKGETLQIVGVADRPDVYSVPFHRLKFTSSYSFGKNDQMSLGLKASNILNDEKAKVFRAFRAQDQYYSRLDPGRSFSLSFGYKF